MKQNQKVIKLLAAVFTLISLILVAVSIVVYENDTAWKKDAIAVTATITDYRYSNSSSSRFAITYEVDGKEYNGFLSYDDSRLYIGSQVTIYISSENPDRFRDESAGIVALVLGIMGAVFMIPAIVLWCVNARGRRREAYLRSAGTQVMAEIMEIQPSPIYVNSRVTYMILCRFTNPQDDTTYIFKSSVMSFDPSNLLQERGITALPVYVDKYNFKKYWVDTTSIEEKVVVL